ncbi:MAG: hypothetical protein JKY19_10100 [Alcanivoracaceae bacterium]|nr:hypothetical protein [Alcanivoracaceae bacterium]
MQYNFINKYLIRGHYAILGILLSTSTLLAKPVFPGGEPITPSDLTTSATLPAPPPKYNPQDPISHTAFARFAWRQFIYLNSPGNPSGNTTPGQTTIVRGVVDASRNFVDSGANNFYQSGKTSTDNFSSNILVWESYAHRSELFPKNATPVGNFQTLNPQYIFENISVASTSARFNNLDENSQIGQNKIFFPKNGNTPSTNPYDDYEIIFEAKVNQGEYDYVKSLGGKAPASFNLPPNSTNNNEAIEIKAAWRVLTNDLINSGRYHTAEALYYLKDETTGVTTSHVGTFGLVGLHIIRKMENYEALVFSSFEHVDNVVTASGAETGLYFFTLYNQLDYQGTVGSNPDVIINNGVNHIQYPLPKQGAVVASNGYDFIPGNYTLPAGPNAGPIKVVQPPTITKAVIDVNTEVKAAMVASGQFSDSVWQYYILKGVQPLPVDEDTSITGTNNPLTQDFFLANNVVESSQPGIQLFKGGAPGPVSGTFPNPRSGSGALNIQNVPGLPASANQLVMGGCMGCHGQAKYNNTTTGKTDSIFSFLISTNNLNGTGGFEADELNESDKNLVGKAAMYMAKKSK